MTTTAGLPLPSLSRGRFAYVLDDKPGSSISNVIYAYTDESLFDACGVRVAFAERSGGVSEAPFDSLDMGAPGIDGNQDYSEKVGLNRRVLVCALGVQAADTNLICPSQVHRDTIVEVHEAGESAARVAQEHALKGADAVLVNCSSTAALLRFADCLPLILVAPTGAFSVVHCGWKGTIAHLAAKAVTRLAEAAACEPHEINAYIGGYIHVECFEVEEEVAQKFMADFSPEIAYVNSEARKWHVDLGAAVRHDLQSCGVALERIADIDKCTVCDEEHFFSYRASGGTCGRHGAFAVKLSDTKMK